MDMVRRWLSRIRGLVAAGRVEREVVEEMRFHLEMEARERVARGLSPEAARREANLAFGSVERYRAEAREARWGRPLEVLAGDLRLALRLLGRNPGFTAVVLLTLALGIGASTTIFSVVDTVLLRPLPYSDAADVVRIRTSWTSSPRADISPAEYRDYERGLTGVFAAVGVYAFGSANTSLDGEAASERVAALSSGVFAALGVEPVLGRTFTAEEDRRGERLALISDSLWTRRFARAADVVGRRFQADGEDFEVIGVLPASFRLPEEILSGQASQVVLPLGVFVGEVPNRGSHFLAGVARIRKGVGFEAARQALEALAAGFAEQFPDAYPRDMGFAATAVPIADEIRGPVRRPVAVLAGAVVLLLLITCANVANLLLVRADRRERDFTVRAALGAGRGRLAVQAVVEGGLLAVLGGGLGLALSALASGLLAALAPAELPWLAELRPDARVLGFGAAIAALTGLLVGLLPVVQTGRRDLTSALKEAARSSCGSRRSQRAQNALVVAEVALALVLLVGAGLLARSFAELLAVDPGFRTQNVVTTAIELPSQPYGEGDAAVAFYRELVPRLAAIPGVRAAGAVRKLPLATRLGDISFLVDGRPVPTGTGKPHADWQVVTPGYLDAMGLTLVGGRGITAADTADAAGAVVINETFARLHWPGENALGKRIRLPADKIQPEWATVVGVVADVRHESLRERDVHPQMYFAHEQFRMWDSGATLTGLTVVLHSSLPVADLRREVRRAVDALEPRLPLAAFRTMAAVRAGSLAVPRLLMAVVAAFSVVAFALAAVGLYGVLAYSVGRRVPELCLRMALGAAPAGVARLVLGQGLRLVAAGVALGLAGAAGLTRVLAGLLYEVDPADPWTLGAVVVLLALTALLAAWGPARRATRAEPAGLLRAE